MSKEDQTENDAEIHEQHERRGEIGMMKMIMPLMMENMKPTMMANIMKYCDADDCTEMMAKMPLEIREKCRKMMTERLKACEGTEENEK